MDAEAILHELTYAEELPREALLAASERRDDMVPIFLREIEAFLATPPEERGEPSPLFFIFHLLGDWQAKTAYRPLSRLLRLPRDKIDAVLGDSVTGTAHRVMAAVYDGDPQPLFQIILDPEADEFVRSGMCTALAMVTLSGDADHHQIELFLRDCFMKLKPQAENFVWAGWQEAIAMLGLRELKPIVKKAFDRRYISTSWLSFEDFEEDLARSIERPGEPLIPGSEKLTHFGDTIEEFSTWYCFSEQYKEDQARWKEQAEKDALDPYDEMSLTGPSHDPAVNLFKNVGRNDPCPCGSGKKFKKCCLQQ